MQQAALDYFYNDNAQIVFRQVCKRFPGGIRALDDITFSIESGEMVFLTGHSGAGKSSLLKLMSMQQRVTRGQLRVAGRDLTRLPVRQIPGYRRTLGLVFQDHQLLMNKSVFDNVALPLVIAGLGYRDIGKRVRAALESVGLGERGKSLPGMMSAGQQQRVGIARAIVNKPDILLADEPTGNLDPQLSQDIMSLFRSFNERGMTVIIASHDLYLVRKLAQRVLVLQDGQLIDDVDPGQSNSRPDNLANNQSGGGVVGLDRDHQ
ncbi:MAG: cell division ATP-binding protein FtsE [Gammaproteobacteria bacterium]|jgi:cell division transport system ATP-binding protein|nr:cell division ATP-binding protein FtsE [Gammaproteobacteria bacterium]